jgi:nitrite reductase/ring-hydroxylating ferredoxin subunit
MAWHAVGDADKLAPGEMMGVMIADLSIAIYNLEGTFYATHNICTHAYAVLTDGGYIDGGNIECPIHQGLFDIRTGKALEGPVDIDLKTYPVRVEGGKIEVEV